MNSDKNLENPPPQVLEIVNSTKLYKIIMFLKTCQPELDKT